LTVLVTTDGKAAPSAETAFAGILVAEVRGQVGQLSQTVGESRARLEAENLMLET
jgi:hypothetical protein